MTSTTIYLPKQHPSYYNNLSHTLKDRTPYTYLIGWSKLNMWYYGRRTGRDVHPSDFWVTYFTSSKHVEKFRKDYGEPDVIQIRQIFSSVAYCKNIESRVLKYFNISNNDNWLNKKESDVKWDTSGVVPWNKGLNKSNSEKVLNIGIKISEVNRNNPKFKRAKSKKHVDSLTIHWRNYHSSIEAQKHHQNLSDRMKTNNPNKGGLTNPRADKRIYCFHNIKTNDIFNGTRFDFRSKYDISYSDTLCIMNNKRGHKSGWHIQTQS